MAIVWLVVVFDKIKDDLIKVCLGCELSVSDLDRKWFDDFEVETVELTGVEEVLPELTIRGSMNGGV